MFFIDSYIRSSDSQRGFEISWATRLNHILSLHNGRMSRSCPFQSKTQGSWQVAQDVTEAERNVLGSNPSCTERAGPLTLRDLLSTHCLRFSVFWSHPGPSLSYPAPCAAAPAAPSTPRLPRPLHKVTHADFQTGNRKTFPTHPCVYPFPITSFPRKKKIQLHKGSSALCSPTNILFLLLTRFQYKHRSSSAEDDNLLSVV